MKKIARGVANGGGSHIEEIDREIKRMHATPILLSGSAVGGVPSYEHVNTFLKYTKARKNEVINYLGRISLSTKGLC